jgi:hypothetical protein
MRSVPADSSAKDRLGKSHLHARNRRMRPSLARYSAPVSFVHAPSLADFITNIVGFKFSVHTGAHPKAGSRCSSAGSVRAAPSRSVADCPSTRFPTPIAAKTRPVPTQERFGPDDHQHLQDRWKPAIQLDKEPSIMVGQLDATMRPTPQNNQLMSKHRVLGIKPRLRLEWRGQDGQSEPKQPDH